jgi:beta-phosphoglucomutase-like phosphatase (HAD superfamily)
VRPRAVIFDFNGTLSQDEPILCEIFVELFAEQGKPLSAQEYFDELAGLSDPEIVQTWLGPDHPNVEDVIAARTARYRTAVADGSTVSEDLRAVVRYGTERVPLGIVSGAALEEIEPVVEAAGIADAFSVIVTADDIEHGKPDPEGYVRALTLFDEDIDAGDVLVLEDTEAGVASAKAAGMRCFAVLGTLAPERLRGADEIVERIDVPLMQRLLG